MKKLMTALAVCLAAGFAVATGGGVVSSNIVGYVTQTSPGTYWSSGSMFITVGSSPSVWHLSDVVASGMDINQDSIQFLDPTDASTLLAATYISPAYALANSLDPAYVGWWNYPALDTRLDNTEIPVGTGFLSSFGSSGVQITYAGQVVQNDQTVDLSGLTFPMVANTTPVDLVLSNVTATGMDINQDSIQYLDPTDASTSLAATFISSAYALANSLDPAYVGWWNYPALDTRLDTTVFKTGSAVLCSLGSPSVTITFPNPMH